MTAMRNGEKTDSISSRKSMNDQKFAFLTQITRPDYRSLPPSINTSQTSLPTTPITAPIEIGIEENGTKNEILVFKEFGAPIATPEDEFFDEIDIKNEKPVTSKNADETEITEQIIDNENKSEKAKNEEFIRGKIEDIVGEMVEQMQFEGILEASWNGIKENEKDQEVYITKLDRELMEEELKLMQKSIEMKNEEEEIRKMTESFGEPRKAVLERVDVEDDEDEDDENNEHNDSRKTSKNMQSNKEETMVFSWSNSSERTKKKPKNLELNSENGKMKSDSAGEGCSKIENKFSIDVHDNLNDSNDEENIMESSSFSTNEGMLQQSLLQLQKQLRKSDVKCSRLEKICEFQQKDIDSLRYEVDWKDKRIEYLQKALEEMENATSSSSPN